MTESNNFEEIRLNIRDEALSICKRNDHSRVEIIHLLYGISKFLGNETTNDLLSLEVIEEKLKLMPRSPSIALVFSGEFESEFAKVLDHESALQVAKDIWESLSLEGGTISNQEPSAALQLEANEVSSPTPESAFSQESPADSKNPVANSGHEEPATSENRRDTLVQEIDQLVTRKKEKNSQLTTIELEKQKIIGEFEDYLKAEEDIRDWRAERQRSFAWKLISRTRKIESQLQEDEKRTLEFVNKPIELDDEFSKKTRNWVLKNLLSNFGLLGIVCLALWLIRRFESSILDFFSQSFNNGFVAFFAKLIFDVVSNINYGQVLLYAVLASLLAFIGMLFGYSRRLDEYSFELHKHLEETRVIEEVIAHVRKGRERVGALHPQIDQLLRIYSMSLHGPWAIDPQYENFSGVLPDTSEIPESLEFAIPTEASIDEKFEGLVLQTLNYIQKTSWRSDALEKLVSALMTSLGMPNNGDAIKQQEADHRMGGKRRVLLEQGEELRRRILLQIGDRKVREYSRIVQERVLPKLQPDVKSLRPDPLEGLELTDSLGARQDAQVSAWEKKLTETAGKGTALSALNYSNSGKANSKHLELITSMFICSNQVQVDKSIDRQPEVNAGDRPFEVSIRVDLSSWCKPGDLLIFDGLESSTESSSHSRESENLQDSNLVF